MKPPIISLQQWLGTAPGRYLLAWEQAQLDLAVADLFGFNALQLGLPELPSLRSNRMPHRWVALPEEAQPWTLPPDGLVTFEGGQTVDMPPGDLDEARRAPDPAPQGLWAPRVALVTDAAALPFPAASLDLVVLPHTLELSADPHAVLREVERVLRPEGRVVISGLNPLSWWGLRQFRAHTFARLGLRGSGLARLYLPETGEFIGHWRLRDWLRLLSFDVEFSRFGCYRPAVRSDQWLQRFDWMDRLGRRWWPVFGAVYFLVAVKRVRGMHLLGPAWKPRRAAAAPVAVARKPSLQRRAPSHNTDPT